MKSFNEWMNEEETTKEGTNKRYVAFQPELIPHPILVAEHVWIKCAEEYTLRLDKFLNELRIIMPTDIRVQASINMFKEELIQTMVKNAAGFEQDSVETPQPKTVDNFDPNGEIRKKLNLV